MSVERPRVFVFLERGLSLEAWCAKAPVNSPTPYGYGAAADVVDLTWSVDAAEGRLAGVLRRALRRVLGFDLVHAMRNRRKMCAAEVVWTHTERESLAAVALLRLTRNRSTRVLAQSVWLWDDWPTYSAARRAWYRWLLTGVAVEATLSTHNRDLSRAQRGEAHVYCVPFGAALNAEVVDAVARSTPAGAAEYALAVGSDRHRDWPTLHAAARMLPEVPFRVATVSPQYPEDDMPPNVTRLPTADLEDVYRAYRKAAVVVLPLTENSHVSGCTVALEAQQLGVPLITADVGGLGMYLGEAGVARYECGDPASLAAAVETAWRRRGEAAPERASAVAGERGLTADDYVARFVLLTRWILTGDPDPASIEELTPKRSVLVRTPA